MRWILKAGAEGSWNVDPQLAGDMEESVDGVSLDAALYEAAGQIAGDAGSDLLESPSQWDRDRYRLDVFDRMRRALRGPGFTYRSPDRMLYVLVEEER